MLKKSLILMIIIIISGSSIAAELDQDSPDLQNPQDNQEMPAPPEVPQNIQVPSNMVEFTCQDFEKKSKTCESYNCQTPSVQDPTITTDWKIVESKNQRCVITNTINSVGLQDESGNSIPITKTCEYDESGIAALNNLMNAWASGYFSPSNAGVISGAHNCTLTSDGNPIKPEPYTVSTDDDNN